MNDSVLFLSLMLPGTLFLGLYDILLRKLLKERTINERFLMGINYTIEGIFFLLILFSVGVPEIKEAFWFAFGATLALGIFSQWFWFRAFAEEEASLISPIRLITPPLVILTGFFILGELPSVWSAIGIFITIIGLFVLLRSEARYKKISLKKIIKRKGVLFAVIGAVAFAFSFPFDKQAVISSSGLFVVAAIAPALGIISIVISRLKKPLLDNVRTLSGKWHSVIVIMVVHALGFVLATVSLQYALAASASSVKRLLSFWAVLFSGKLLQEKNIGTKIFATVIMLLGIVITLLFE